MAEWDEEEEPRGLDGKEASGNAKGEKGTEKKPRMKVSGDGSPTDERTNERTEGGGRGMRPREEAFNKKVSLFLVIPYTSIT